MPDRLSTTLCGIPLRNPVIAASGTLAQIIPPSLVLIVMADQLGRSVGDMYAGAFIPGFILTSMYALYVFGVTMISPKSAPALPPEARSLRGMKLLARVVFVLIPPLALIFLVLGTIFIGITLLGVFLLWRGTLFEARWMLWIIMLATPFPYIATTAGWVTAEVRSGDEPAHAGAGGGRLHALGIERDHRVSRDARAERGAAADGATSAGGRGAGAGGEAPLYVAIKLPNPFYYIL